MKEYWWLYFLYLFNCKRQLWLYHKWINTNNDNLNIILWKINHDNNNDKEFKIWNIAIDKITKKSIYEYKKSSSNLEWWKAQLENYIYILNNNYNIKILKWIIKYKNGKEIEIKYDKWLINRYKRNYKEIEKIINWKCPGLNVNKNLCKKCWYYEKCYI